MSIRIGITCRDKGTASRAARYLFRKKGFKIMRFDDGVTSLLRRCYIHRYKKFPYETKRELYDACHAVDPTIWIQALEGRLVNTVRDVVTPDAVYSEEFVRLKNSGYTLVRITVPEGKTHVSRKLSSRAQAGTMAVREAFGNMDDLGVDYSIFGSDWTEITNGLDHIVDKLHDEAL
jgi:hypothetical protein